MGFFVVKTVERGGDHGTEDHMGGMEDVKQPMRGFMGDIAENQHAGNAGRGAEKREKDMVFELGQDEFKFIYCNHLRLPSNIGDVYSCAISHFFLSNILS